MGGKILVLGLGNTLLTDDGIGLHVIAALDRDDGRRGDGAVVVLDGGTLGLFLLPKIEAATALIVVDTANFGGAPGDVRVFDADAMDVQLGAAKSSAHELALADLIGAARLSGSLPERRALVGVAPLSVQWGLEPTPEVAASIPLACAKIESLIERWAA
jgi:hydrogenase maturation protease